MRTAARSPIPAQRSARRILAAELFRAPIPRSSTCIVTDAAGQVIGTINPVTRERFDAAGKLVAVLPMPPDPLAADPTHGERARPKVLPRMERCRAQGCRHQIPSHTFMCFGHWKLVPKELRDAIRTTRAPGPPTPAYQAAATAAVRWVADHELPPEAA